MRGGAGTALVGDPETVYARMKEYAALGIETFVLSGYPSLEEAYSFAEGVFPLIRHDLGSLHLLSMPDLRVLTRFDRSAETPLPVLQEAAK